MNLNQLKENIMAIHKHKTDDHYQNILNYIHQFSNLVNTHNQDVIPTLLPVINSLLTHKEFKYKQFEFLHSIDVLLLKALTLVINNLNTDNSKLSEVFRSIFDPNKNYYEYNNLETDIERIVFFI